MNQMFETAKKYSETMYYRKTDLEQEMDHYLVEPLWHEISQYRSFFRQDFPIREKKTYFIRNPHVNDLMAQTQELMLQWLLEHKEEHAKDVDGFWLKEEEQLRFSSFLIKMRYDKGMSAAQVIQECFDKFSLEGIVPYEVRLYIQDTSNNLLCKLFLICMSCDKRSAFLLLYPTLYLHHSLLLSNVFSMEECIDHIDRKLTELDVTPDFLSFLSFMRLKVSDDMAVIHHDEAAIRLMDEVTLIEQYPMLQKESIAFYVQHRKLHHYYTLQDYMSFAKVCYETARYSMEKLVELKWYQKQKIGKKFVYFIL